MKKLTLLILLMGGMQASTFAQSTEKPFVIPAIKYWKSKNKTLAFGTLQQLVVDARYEKELMPYVKIFKNDLIAAQYCDSSLQIKTGKAAANALFFTLGSADKSLGKEGYILNIDKGISIQAATALGAFWATRTILQLLEQNKNLPTGEIKDYPDYAVRGFVLDVARKFFSLAFLKDYVKFMSYYKMNDFQIHLNDNGFKDFFLNDWTKTYSAFRLQNDTYPNLTAKDGSYTKVEFRDLQLLAQQYGVTIVPELDAPAHVLAITQAMPELGSKKYGMDHLDLDNPKTYEVIDHIFKEYVAGPNPVFVGQEVHIGTDEYAKEASEKFRAFTDHYIKYVESFGKKVRMWGALTHAQGSTPVKSENVTMNLWYNGYADPTKMMDLGYDAISTPDGWLYIVPMAGYYADYLDNQKIYNEWAPNRIGNQTFDPKNPHLRGGSFAVWNDVVGNGISERDVHHRVFRSMQVLSQKMWDGAKADLSYDTFSQQSKNIGEGPGLNLLGKINMEGQSSLKIALKDNPKIQLKDAEITADGVKLNSKNSEVKLPYQGLGYDYTISFDIKPAADNEKNAVIFSNRDTQLKLKQQGKGKLGFSRDGYNFAFNYEVPANVWTRITLTGNNMHTTLYINGQLVEALNPQRNTNLNAKEELTQVKTLFFPLENIGGAGHSFVGEIAHLEVYNKELSAQEISSFKAH